MACGVAETERTFGETKMRRMTLACILLMAAMGLGATSSAAQAAGPPASQARTFELPMTIAHTEVMKVSPDRLWAEIKRMYVEGQKFSGQGYKVEPLTDAQSWLGGTRVSRTLADGTLEERVARISALDDSRRFLALSVRYSEGMVVRASYEVRPHPAGSEFQLVAHVDQPFELPSDDAAGRKRMSDAARAVAATETRELADAWAGERVRIEKGQ
jgi:hypothetical protein